jgi:glycosyltransferase involved in cell wall biosynthesis
VLLYTKELANTNDENIISWRDIFIKMKKHIQSTTIIKTKNKMICFIADGGFSEWNGMTIETSGLGGSETYIVMISKYMKLFTDATVCVFCNTPIIAVYNNVIYYPLEALYNFLATYHIDICIISRYSEYIPIASNSDVDEIYFVVHDLTASGNIIISTSKLKKIFCMTNWHREYFLNIFPMFKDITYVHGNGILPFKYNNIKQPFKFIYSSYANRGLLPLLEMWNDILEITSSAELYVFCDLENKWLNTHYGDIVIMIKKILPLKNVFTMGWTDKETLYQAWSTSHIWLYPCTFKETFCITALEAGISNTLVITNDLGGLIETVGDRGIIISGDIDDAWKTKALCVLKNIYDNMAQPTNTYIDTQTLINKNYTWAQNMTWLKQTQRLLSLIN